MKSRILVFCASVLVTFASLTAFSHRLSAAAPASILPDSLLEIESIEQDGTNIVVSAQVAYVYKRVTLESRIRVGSGAWVPRAVQHLEPGSTPVRTIRFQVPFSSEMEVLRLRGETVEELPRTFYTGSNTFQASSIGSDLSPPGGDASADMGRENNAAGPDQNGRDVVESDIWKIQGDTLYFFNQYRGLQVIDISNPDQPVLRTTFDLPGAGEQMYVLDDHRVVLLARDLCGGGSTAQSSLVFIEIENDKATLAAQIPVQGSIRESRLVGSALYLVSEQYREIRITAPVGAKESASWEWGSQVISYDLSDFSTPVPKSAEWVAGYGNVIYATDTYLFVTTQEPINDGRWWWTMSNIRVFNISSPDGVMETLATIKTSGQVKDKFKMNVDGSTFTAVTETQRGNLTTQVETFSLADPKNPQALATLPIIEGERLFATRFDGKLLYAVTYFVVDPLWIIDLSDPTQPKKVGHLEIPGWSTFIQPLGDRLVTIGMDDTENKRRVAVQLFDVSNPAEPRLASKVILGEDYSWSEGTSDEKAFAVLPESNLILVPYSTWSQSGNTQAVGLIDFTNDTLTKRGIIEHEMQPRRAAMQKDRILSISSSELISVDATDRDKPKVASVLELSWSVDRVILAGEHLLELSSPWDSAPLLRVVSANDLAKVQGVVKLKKQPLLGASLHEQRLYVLQGAPTEYIWPETWNSTNYVAVKTNSATLTLSIYDASALPELRLLGEAESTIAKEVYYWNNFRALFPKAGVLVWAPDNSSSGWWIPWHNGGVVVADFNATLTRPAAGVAVDIAPRFWRPQSAQLVAYSTETASAPALLSEVNLQGTNSWWNFSAAHNAGPLIYISHEMSVFDPRAQMPPSVTQKYDGRKIIFETNQPLPGAWVQKSFLNVIDYTDPKDPTLRPLVEIPGSLLGIAREGSLLFTRGYRFGEVLDWSTRREWIDGLAYDGVAAHLVDSIPLPETWPKAAIVHDGHVLLNRTSEATTPTYALEIWNLPATGKFARVSSTALKSGAQSLETFGPLLAAQLGDGVQLVDLTDLAAPKLGGKSTVGSCLGYGLGFADGELGRGLWLPLGLYGAVHIPNDAGEN